jgi:hypothetical protein
MIAWVFFIVALLDLLLIDPKFMASLMSQAVTLDREVRDAIEELDKIKVTQTSSAYEHVGQAARKNLDGLRRTYTESLELKRKRYADMLKTLAKFHEVPRVAFMLDPAKVGEEAKSYTSEAKDWITTVRSHLLAYGRHESKPFLFEPISDPDVDLISSPTPRISSKRPRSSSPDSPSHNTLLARINDCETRLDKLRDAALENATHTRDTLDEKLETRFARLSTTPVPKSISILRSSTLEDGECTPDPPSVRRPVELRVDEFSRKVGEVGSEVSELAKSPAEVQALLNETEKELQSLREEKKELQQWRTSVRLRPLH